MASNAYRRVGAKLDAEAGSGPGSHSSVASQGVRMTEATSMEVSSTSTLPLLGGASEADIRATENPEGGDFHFHEYGKVDTDGIHGEVCHKCAATEEPPELDSKMMVAHFLALTAGPSLTFLCFTLSEAYFVEANGMNVLMDVGVVYAILTLLGLLAFNAAKFLLSPAVTLIMFLVLKTVFTAAVPFWVAAFGSIPTLLLTIAMGINGFSTGMLQSQTAAIAGLLPGTKADSLAHIGSFVSALVTTAIQGVLLALTPIGIPVSARVRMYILFPAAAAITAFGLLSQARVLGMDTYREVAAREAQRLAKLDKRVGKAKVRGRFWRVKWYILGELVTWFVGLYMTAVVPYLRTTSTNAFLSHSFATLLIMSFNVFNFVGSILGTRYSRWQPSAATARLVACIPRPLLSAWRVANVGGRLLYCVFFAWWANQDAFGLSPVASTTIMATVYAAASLSNGFYTVVLSAESQVLCGFTARHLCPIVGTLVWISMQTGSVLGFVASIASAPVLAG